MENEAMPHDHGEEISSHLREAAARTESFRTVSDIFKLLADPSRARIFWLLCHCEECVVNISYLTDMTSPAVSHHLRQLKDGGLIVSRREGKEVYYKAASAEQVRLLHLMMEKTMEARGSVALRMLASWARMYLVLVTYSQKEAAVPSTQM